MSLNRVNRTIWVWIELIKHHSNEWIWWSVVKVQGNIIVLSTYNIHKFYGWHCLNKLTFVISLLFKIHTDFDIFTQEIYTWSNDLYWSIILTVTVKSTGQDLILLQNICSRNEKEKHVSLMMLQTHM